MKKLVFLSKLIAVAALFMSAASSLAQSQGPNGHFYKVVLENGLTWDQAQLKAAESTHNGAHGHLATITSAEEDQFIEQLRIQAAPGGAGSLWVGGYQDPGAASPASGWTWINGEGAFPGANGQSSFANWQPGEPNGDAATSPTSGVFLSIGHMNQPGWNDEFLPTNTSGYVVEYSSPGSDAVVRVSAPDPAAAEIGLSNVPPDTATFEFTRTGDLSLDLPVFYSIHGTASNGHDYDEISRSIIIPAGQPSATLTIVPRADLLTVVEPMETVGIRLEPSLILNPLASYRIDPANREAAAVIYEHKPNPNGALEIAVPKSGIAYELGEPITILAALHYSNVVSEVHFFANDMKIGSSSPSSRTGGLQFHKITWSNAPAGSYTLTARATKPDGAELKSSSMSIVVKATHDTPIVSIRFINSPTTEPWPDADFSPGHFEVTRVGPITHDLPVYYAVSGTATAGSDYETLPGYVVIGAGKTTARFVIAAKDDTIPEPTETVTITLIPSGPVAFSIDPPNTPPYEIDPNHRSATGLILDNDEEPVIPVVSIWKIQETTIEPSPTTDVAPATFAVRRTGPTNAPLAVHLFWSGTATIDEDYQVPSRTIEIPAGKNETLVHIVALDDALIEGDETIVVSLNGPSAPPPFYRVDPEHSSTTLFIKDNDSPSHLTIVRVDTADPSATEFSPFVDAFDSARFVISRQGDLTQTLQVFFSLHGTAIHGEDYQRVGNNVIFQPGQQSITIHIVPLSDFDQFVHKFEIISQPGLTWDQARAQAETATYLGISGHLATITSLAEDEEIERLRQQAGGGVYWVGGYQEPGEPSATEGWKWLNNEGPISGYQNWLEGEPNDYWGPGSENHMVIGWLHKFGWNDQGANIGAQGYVVEFDIPTPAAPVPNETMETVGIRLEDPPYATLLPAYLIHSDFAQTAAVIFERQPPADGAIEIAIPSAGAKYPEVSEIEFVAAAYHPTLDITRVKWLIDGVQVGDSEGKPADNSHRGVILHWFDWKSVKPGDHIVQAFADLDISTATFHSSQIPFSVEGAQQNKPPVAQIARPSDGAVFLLGDPIKVVAEGSDPDGTLLKLELIVDGSSVASTNGHRLETTLRDLAVGPHTLHARATDNLNATGLSLPVRILVRHRDAVSFVRRDLPETYSPGVPFTVQLHANPPDSAHAYAVEDQPPAGWQVSEISHGGAFDATNRKVKFGPFTDALARTLTYRLAPPANATGRYEFDGQSSLNGALYPISGDQFIQLIQQHHPADTNNNFAIVLSEVTAYAAAWKAGHSWPTGPVPIPLSYVTRAGYIWKRGETYRFDPALPAPACWIPLADDVRIAAFTAPSTGSAQRSIIGTEVRINVTPPSGAASYALEEKPPRGWAISNISHDGIFDPATGIIRWGVFFDATPRALTYTVTSPTAVSAVGSFNGQFSADGRLAEITSANSLTVNGDAPIQITDCDRNSTGVQLRIAAPSGQTAVIEGSADLENWTELKSIFVPNGVVEFTDETAPASGRFYRLRVQ